jgi:AraC-like DNA-binding protein
MDIRLTFSDMGTVGSDGLPALVLHEHWGRHRIELRSGTTCRFTRMRTNHRHRHLGYHELVLVTKGTGHYRHGRTRIDLGAGLAFRAVPGTIHEISSPAGDLELIFVSLRVVSATLAPGDGFPERVLDAFLAGARLAAPAPHVLPLLAGLSAHGPRGVRAWTGPALLRLITVNLLAVLACEAPAFADPASPPDDPVDQACRYIDQHLAAVPDADTIARAVGLGERQLRRRMTARLGHGIVAEVNRRRLNAAAQHLLMGWPVAATARSCGFTSAAVFTRTFRARFACTPSAYRRQHAAGIPMIEHTPPQPARTTRRRG